MEKITEKEINIIGNNIVRFYSKEEFQEKCTSQYVNYIDLLNFNAIFNATPNKNEEKRR